MPSEIPHTSTLIELLCERARLTPDRKAFTVLQDGENESESATYSQLHQRVRQIAVVLQERTRPGDRVVLLFPTGLDYVASFFACLYAGVIAVPTYPPRNIKAVAKLQALMSACKPRTALASADIHANLGAAAQLFPALTTLDWINIDQTRDVDATQWRQPQPDPTRVAFLQYTSGSTATPRGVVVTHHNLLANQAMIGRAFAHPEQETAVSWLPLYHDMGLIGMVIQPVFIGCHCVLMPPMAFVQEPYRWLKAITTYRAATSGGPNFAYQLCVDRISAEQRSQLDLSHWAVAFNGAEPIRERTLARFAETFAECGFRSQALFPCYGLAEATLMVSAARKESGYVADRFQRTALESMRAELSSEDDSLTLVSSGRVPPELHAVIVNPADRAVCADGEVGEIWLTGDNVTQGYWEQQEATEALFGARIPGDARDYFRTGDLGFTRAGELFVTGRMKDTLVIEGRNLYPQDIELTAEQSHPLLRAGGCAAFAVDGEVSERLGLAAEVERRAIRDLDSAEMFTALRRAVMEVHEVPLEAIVLLKPGQMPKTSSGKIQRHAVRAQFQEQALKPLAEWTAPAERDSAAPAAVSEYGANAVPPRNPVESALADIWREVLELGSVGVHDNLLEWGAQSLQATQICSRIAATLGVQVSIADLLDHPTIAELASWMKPRLDDGAGDELAQLPPLVTGQRPQPLPLAWSQERMWFIHQLLPDSAAYNMAVGIRFRGPLVESALEQALSQVVQRHEALRTTFKTVGGTAFQDVAANVACQVQLIDLTSAPETEHETRLRQRSSEQAGRPFDLERGPLFRFELYRLSDQHRVLTMNIHHTAGDAWSYGVLVRELGELYEAITSNRDTGLAEPSLQYGDFACWQRTAFSGRILDAQMRYWRQKLEGVSVLALPTDHPRPPVQSQRGGLIALTPESGLLDSIRGFSRVHGVTPFMTIMSAFLVMLQRYSGQGDIALGTSIANRHHVATEGMIGTFVNTLVMRNDLGDDPSFADLLARVRTTALEAYAHQDLSFEQLVAELQPVRDLSHAPLFQIMFNYLNVPTPENRIGETVWSVVDIDRKAAQFDLTLAIIDTRRTQRMSFEYNADLFDESTVKRMLGQLQVVLSDAVARPTTRISKLTLLTAQEMDELILGRNRTTRELPHQRCLHEAFTLQAQRTPEAIAAVFQSAAMSYRELDQRSDSLAAYLQSRGAQPGQLIGICLHRSLDMLVALLAILKTGAAYVPLDPAFPRERLRYMIGDAHAPMLVSQAEVAEWLLEDTDNEGLNLVCVDREQNAIAAMPPESRQPVELKPESLAYVIYTSGSTGHPKGVEISHASVMNFLASMAREPGLQATDTLLSVTTLSFDIAVLELYLPLTQGARVVMVGREVAYDARRLADYIADSGATVMQATPATWRMLLDDGWQGSSNLKVLCGGEALPRDLAAKLLDRVGTLWNMYGPTETTVWSAVGQINDVVEPINVGRPIANTQIYILDPQLQPVPTGAVGELWIGGAGLAAGYLDRPQLTAEKFVRSPFSDQPTGRIYATGDLARYLGDGRIEIQGRSDFQVKIRGFRIELGEVEATLTELPGVNQATVVAMGREGGEKRLVGYLVADAEHSAESDQGKLRRRLLETLPDYMIPSRLVFLDSLPLTPNGKIDRLALPDPGPLERGDEEDYLAPRTPFEETLSQIFAELLEVDRVGVRDNFFALGGHSLIATRLISQVRDTLEIEVPLRLLFEHPTVEALALEIGELKAASLDDATLDALLADLEHLSDEEIEALVQQEQNDTH